MKNLSLLIILLFSAGYLYAQPYYFKHYQVENGLSNNTVFCSIQDSRGFMWFGTKDGLNRFDGYSFKTYRHDPANPRSIGNDLIFAMYTDKHQTLWVGTNNGVYRYNPIYESFEQIKETKGMRINDIGSDSQGNLWIISLFRIYSYNIDTKTFYHFKNEAKFEATSVSRLSDGSSWFCTMQGTIEQYKPLTKTFESHYVLKPENKEETGCISRLAETENGKLIIGTTNHGIKLYDPKTRQLKELLTLNQDKTPIFVRDIRSFSHDEFWIGTESGVYVYNSRSGKIAHLQKQYSNAYSLSDNAVYTLCRDKEGGIWTGTYFGGINYYSGLYSIFTKYFPQKENNSISGSDVREICRDKDGNFWIGTEDAGLNQLNPKTGVFKNFLPDGGKQSIAYSNIHGLLVDGGNLWIGTFEHGLDIMDIKSGKIIKHYTAGKGNSLRTNFIVTFCKTRSGEIIVATIAGIYKYNRKTDDFDAIPGLPFAFFYTVIEDHEGTIWVGSFNDGLFSFHPGKKGFKNYRHDDKVPGSLSSNTINGLFQDSKKKIWIATDGGGLCRLDTHTGKFKRYTVKNGLPSNYIFRIEEDNDQKLWISSTKGLIRFDPGNESMKIYSRSNGLLTDQFNYSSSYKDADGRLYFGSVKGLISFRPSQLYTTSYIAPVFITGFQIDNTEIPVQQKHSFLKKSVLYTDTITLNNSQSSFSIDFAALSFFSPEMTEYAYRMNGLYKDWEYLKTNRKVYFTKLSPGDYLFEAKALVNGSDEWSQKNVRMLIRVLPPFWKSTVAYICYAALLISIVSWLISGYHNRQERKNQRRMEVFENEKEKEIYHAKIEFFTNVAHEIRTPLTLIKGPMEKLMKQSKEIPAIEKNLKIMDRSTERLFTLTNQLLDFRKTETSGFSLNFVKANISEIIREISIDFQDAAEERNIGFKTLLPDKPFFAYVDIEAFHKIMSNLTDNALKYGKTKVIISLVAAADTDDAFYIRVMNDGKLIPDELAEKIFEPFYRARATEIKPGTGIGLSISRSLAELHQGSLTMEKTNTNLNIFIVRLPVHQLIEFNLNGQWKKI